MKKILISLIVITYIYINILILIPAIWYYPYESSFGFGNIKAQLLVPAIYISFIFLIIGIFYSKGLKFIIITCIPTILWLWASWWNIPIIVEELAFQHGYYNSIDTSNIEEDSYVLSLEKTNTEYPWVALTINFKGAPPDKYYVRMDRIDLTENYFLRILELNEPTNILLANTSKGYLGDLITLNGSTRCLRIESIFDNNTSETSVTVLNFDTWWLYIKPAHNVKLYHSDIVSLFKKTQDLKFQIKWEVWLENYKIRINNRYQFNIESPINPWKAILDTIIYAKINNFGNCTNDFKNEAINLADLYKNWE